MTARSRLRTYLVRLSTHAHLAVLALGMVLACALLTAGLGPTTPLALDRAERSLAQGDVYGALATCEQTAHWAPLPSWRAQARYRAATLRAHHLDQPAQAVRELRTLLHHGGADPQLEALALQLLAESLEIRGKHRQVAEAYERLARISPRPALWLQAAALAWERTGRPDRALLRHAGAAAHDPQLAAQALLAMGRISLGVGRSDKAYAFYAAALQRDPSHEQARLARLGMAMALDAMGRFEQALAELDEASPERDRAIGIARDRVLRRAAEEPTAP